MYDISPEGYLNQYHREREAAALKRKEMEVKESVPNRSLIPLLLSMVIFKGHRERL